MNNFISNVTQAVSVDFLTGQGIYAAFLTFLAVFTTLCVWRIRKSTEDNIALHTAMFAAYFISIPLTLGGMMLMVTRTSEVLYLENFCVTVVWVIVCYAIARLILLFESKTFAS